MRNTLWFADGAGVGIVMKTGASTGGVDIPPLILNKLTGVSVGTMMLVQNAIIIFAQTPFSTSEEIIYGVISVILTSITVDKVLLMGKQQAQVIIISPYYETIRTVLLEHYTGVTMVPIETGYEGKTQAAVFCAVPVRKREKIKNEVIKIDADAFLLVNPVNEILGRGFTLPR